RKHGRPHGPEIDVAGVQRLPVLGREEAQLLQIRRELDHAVAVVERRAREAVAGRYVEVARVVDRWTGRRPDAAGVRRGHLVREQRTASVDGDPDDPAVILAAITVESAERRVDR